MKRAVIATLCLIGLATALLANSPHFVSASGSNNDGSLELTFKESGLGTAGTTVDISATGTDAFTWVCVNGGGKNPSASNKSSSTSQVTTPPTPFTVGKNGTVTGALTLDTPDTLTCPSGQDLELACSTFTNVTITDDSFGDSTFLAGPFTFVSSKFGQFCGQ